MFYLYRVNNKDNTFYLAITERKPPKKSTILVAVHDRDEFAQLALVHHKNTVNNPLRVPKPEVVKASWRQLPEAIEKIRLYRTGKVWPAQIKAKISRTLKNAYATKTREPNRSNRGQKFSAETKAKMSRAHHNRRRVRCEHCGVISALNMYHRWHGDNCRMNW